MHIIVDGKKKLHVLQSEFNDAFRFLKLEFPAVVSSANKHLRNNTICLSNTISEVSKTTTAKQLTITPSTTITALKKQFMDLYGFPVQVMRRFGTTWVETTVTDGWTLEEQNRHGERLSYPGKFSV